MYWTLELASKLEDAPWPATKEELIDYAVRSGSPLEVLENDHRRLKLVESNGYYLVDRLKDSAPYLTKGAKNLLKEIGKRFQEELDKEGYREHRIIVTAMFRTRRDIAIAQQTIVVQTTILHICMAQLSI